MATHNDALASISKALRARCVFAFAEDPYTEVGKAYQSWGKADSAEPDAWIFYVYVMRDGPGVGNRVVQRSNAVVVTAKSVEVLGPDEKMIGLMLKEAVL